MPSPGRPPTRKWTRCVYSPTALSRSTPQVCLKVAPERFQVSLGSISEEVQFPRLVLMDPGYVTPRMPQGLPSARQPMSPLPKFACVPHSSGRLLAEVTPLKPVLRTTSSQPVLRKPVLRTVSMPIPHFASMFREPMYTDQRTHLRPGVFVTGPAAPPEDIAEPEPREEGPDALGLSLGELREMLRIPDTKRPDAKTKESPLHTARSSMSTASYVSYVLHQSDSSEENDDFDEGFHRGHTRQRSRW
mmetsp:Transcript_30143/g.54637  ORF Transcript_30143/g.54637 Transcript_30143/m.54637 type:complete len:246 (+) Transcript_30143:62-799(+)